MSQTPPITAERLDAKTLSEAHDLFADTTEARAAIVRGITDESAQAMTGVEYRLGVFVASHGLSILAAAREAERLRPEIDRLQSALTKAERERDQARQRATALLCELDTATRERTKAENLLTVWREEATEVVEAFSNYRNARFDPSDHAEIRRINAIDRLISINKRTDRAQAEAGESVGDDWLPPGLNPLDEKGTRDTYPWDAMNFRDIYWRAHCTTLTKSLAEKDREIERAGVRYGELLAIKEDLERACSDLRKSGPF